MLVLALCYGSPQSSANSNAGHINMAMRHGAFVFVCGCMEN